MLAAAAATSVLVTLAIVVVLVSEASTFFRAVGLDEFLTGTTWTPQFNDPAYGVLPLINGTLIVTGIALLVAVPVGIAAAIWLSEYASARARATIKPLLEVLVGVPTIVFGYFALTFFTPDVLRGLVGLEVGFFNALAAGIITGIAVSPVIASVADDAMTAVPAALREGAYALGASRRQVATRIVLPSALSGIVAGIVLGASKAIGETMIVALAAGGIAQMGADPRDPYTTMTAFIAQMGSGDVAVGTVDYQSIFAVGILLFGVTLVLNLLATVAVGRLRERYE